jgi:hypothetical protein
MPPVLSHVEGKGAQPARREGGEYPMPIFNRLGWAKPSGDLRAIPPEAGDRFPNADVFAACTACLACLQ